MRRFDLDHQLVFVLFVCLFVFHLLTELYLGFIHFYTVETPEYFLDNGIVNFDWTGRKTCVIIAFFFPYMAIVVYFQMSLKGTIYPWLCEATLKCL